MVCGVVSVYWVVLSVMHCKLEDCVPAAVYLFLNYATVSVGLLQAFFLGDQRFLHRDLPGFIINPDVDLVLHSCFCPSFLSFGWLDTSSITSSWWLELFCSAVIVSLLSFHPVPKLFDCVLGSRSLS